MRKLAIICLSFAGAVAAAQYLFPAHWLLPGAACCFLLSLTALLTQGKTRSREILLCYGAAFGLLAQYGFYTLKIEPARSLEGQRGQVELTIIGYAEETDYGARIRVELPNGIQALYYGDGGEMFSWIPGDKVRTEAECRSAWEIRQETVRSFYAKGCFLLLYQRGGSVGEKIDHSDHLRYLPQRLCHFLQQRIRQLYSGDAAAFLMAMITGDRSDLSDELYSALVGCGMLHITAVSGLHCMFLLRAIETISGKNRHWLKALLALPLIFLFTMAVGAQPSVMRAFIMILFLLAAPLFGRETDPVTSLSAALCVILLRNPYAIASVGLQLSFGAMAGILWLTPKITKGLQCHLPKNRKLRPLAAALLENLAMTAGASFFTVPICAYYFGEIALISVLANMLLIFLASLIFTLGILAVLLSLIWMPFGQGLAAVTSLAVNFAIFILRLLVKVPYHALYLSNGYLKYWLVYIYLLFFLCLTVARQRRYYIATAVLTVGSLLICLGAVKIQEGIGSLRIEVLDVGQGACVLFTSGGETVLVDCGSRSGTYDAGNIAAQTLLGRGYHRLDYLVLTHLHEDHANGVERLLNMIETGAILLPRVAEEEAAQAIEAVAKRHSVQLLYAEEVENYSFGGAYLTIYPPEEDAGTGNEACLCVRVSRGEFAFISTGDMPGTQEQRLLQRFSFHNTDVLLVGHHGANTSGSEAWLRTLEPKTAVISVGYNNYGHPGSETLQRLARIGASVYRTDRQGNIQIVVR